MLEDNAIRTNSVIYAYVCNHQQQRMNETIDGLVGLIETRYNDEIITLPDHEITTREKVGEVVGEVVIASGSSVVVAAITYYLPNYIRAKHCSIFVIE